MNAHKLYRSNFLDKPSMDRMLPTGTLVSMTMSAIPIILFTCMTGGVWMLWCEHVLQGKLPNYRYKPIRVWIQRASIGCAVYTIRLWNDITAYAEIVSIQHATKYTVASRSMQLTATPRVRDKPLSEWHSPGPIRWRYNISSAPIKEWAPVPSSE